jgi:hypothetical protein
MFLNTFKNLFTSNKALKGIRRRLELLGLEDRIVPAVPFSPAFPHALSINAGGERLAIPLPSPLHSISPLLEWMLPTFNW